MLHGGRFCHSEGEGRSQNLSGVLEATGLSALQAAALLGGASAAAVTDFRTRRIPNLLTGPLWLAGLCWATWTGGFAGLGLALAGSLILAVPFIVLFICARGGAGDAKLMGALGAWVGLRDAALILLLVAACGVLMGFGYALLRGRAGRVWLHLRQMVYAAWLHRRGLRSEAREMLPAQEHMLEMPYALAVLVGVCVFVGVEMTWLR